MSDLDKCIDSKPNNNTGMHFEKNKLQGYFLGCSATTHFPQNGIN